MNRRAMAMWRKACAVLACVDSGFTRKNCPTLSMVTLFQPEALWFSHVIAASMLLDGLDASELP